MPNANRYATKVNSYYFGYTAQLSCIFWPVNFPYDQEWKLIDSLMTKKNLPKSALIEVNKVYAAAKKDKQEAQWVKGNHLQESFGGNK